MNEVYLDHALMILGTYIKAFLKKIKNTINLSWYLSILKSNMWTNVCLGGNHMISVNLWGVKWSEKKSYTSPDLFTSFFESDIWASVATHSVSKGKKTQYMF